MPDETTRTPLVWLPFEPEVLGEIPPTLRYEVWTPDEHGPLPESVGKVAFYVPSYMAPGTRHLEVMAEMRSLQVVQTQTAGVDNVLPHLPPGVTLCNGRGIHDTSTAELAVALALAAQRGIPEFVRAQERGRWEPAVHRSIADCTVLIVGYGNVGAAIEARLLPFEVEVLRVARQGREGVRPVAELPRLLPRADVVIVVVPMTGATRGLVDAGFLAAMKDDALLVNVSRGPVVDTEALLAELGSGRLRAALDVTDPEPLPEGHPLWTAPGVLISPHVGGASTAMQRRAHRVLREQLWRFANRQPLQNVITGDY